MKLPFCLKWALFLIFSSATYAQSVRNEQVIRFENSNDHSIGVSVSASPWTSAEMKVVFPAGMPVVGQILKVDSIVSSRIVLSWADEQAGGGSGGEGALSMARVYYIGTATAPYGVWSKIPFNTESYDLNSEYDASGTQKFKAKSSGYYQIHARVELGQADYVNHVGVGVYIAGIYKNGSLLTCGNTFPINTPSNVSNILKGEFGALIADVVYLVEGDEIEVWVYYNAPNNHARDIVQGEGRTFLSIYKIK